MGGGGVDGVNNADETGLGVYGDAGGVFGHPFADFLVDVGHVVGVVPGIGGALGESGDEFSESAAAPFIGEEGFLGRETGDNRRKRELRRASLDRIQTLEGLLERFERARHICRSEVDEVIRVHSAWQETQLVDVECSQACAELMSSYATAVSEHPQVTYGVDLAAGRLGGGDGVVGTEGFELALPFKGGEAGGGGVEEGGAHLARDGAVGPVLGEAGGGEACFDGGAFAVAEENLDLLEV